MNKIIKFIGVVIFMLSIHISNAQNKIAYINMDSLLRLMPEIKPVEIELKKYQDSLQAQEISLSKRIDRYEQELNRKNNDNKIPASEKVLMNKTNIAIHKELTDWQTTAQELYRKRSEILLEPVKKKVHDAIEAVAKKNRYDYVIDTSETELLIVMPEGINILKLVMNKLNINSTIPKPQ